MAGLVGRKVRLKKGPVISAVALIGARQEDVAITNREVNVTDKSDGGYRTLLDDFAERFIDITVAGVLKDDELLAVAVGAAGGGVMLAEYTLEIDGVGDFVGDFFMNNISVGAPYNSETTFSATFLSSGAYTFTPG